MSRAIVPAQPRGESGLFPASLSCYDQVYTIYINHITKLYGSLGFTVEGAPFWGVNARTRVHTPKCGASPRQFPKNQNYTATFVGTSGSIISIFSFSCGMIRRTPRS